MTWPAVAALAVVVFALTVAGTWPLIGLLRARQFGKAIRVDGPDHQAKAGTPTMGGIAVLGAIIAAAAFLYWQGNAYATVIDPSGNSLWDRSVDFASPGALIWPVLAMFVFALLGLVDDWQGLARKGRARELGVGLTARKMILVQFVAAGLLLLLWAGELHLGAWRSLLLFAAFVVAMVGTVNGVNFSDGLDGLAAGLLAIAFLGLAAADTVGLPLRRLGTDQPIVSPVSALAVAAAAACLGFLVFNRHPARVFMGNLTSMGLGALLASLALVSPVWWVLPITGAVFVAEVLSDIIQVGYYKYSGGRRVFRMAPIHHHFELGGWPETKVVAVFWCAGLVAALAGVAAAAWLARA
jgi:phospho-N-acetylmuramoyl-pentapeptide-transferase